MTCLWDWLIGRWRRWTRPKFDASDVTWDSVKGETVDELDVFRDNE